jgi:hypothetical protein
MGIALEEVHCSRSGPAQQTLLAVPLAIALSFARFSDAVGRDPAGLYQRHVGPGERTQSGEIIGVAEMADAEILAAERAEARAVGNVEVIEREQHLGAPARHNAARLVRVLRWHGRCWGVTGRTSNRRARRN